MVGGVEAGKDHTVFVKKGGESANNAAVVFFGDKALALTHRWVHNDQVVGAELF